MHTTANLQYTIATIGSHSALQILKGAKDEGFKTIAICKKGMEKPYRMFNVADEIILINSYNEFESVQEYLVEQNTILIPHGSFVAYLGEARIKALKPLYFGTKAVLDWESDREKQREWLLKAGLKLPMRFISPEDIDRPVIVKFHGAKGGMGYFLAKNKEDFYSKIGEHPDEKFTIQEYIVGVPVYIHYFYSPLTNELEIMGFDKRYESNVDSLGRISARDQIALPNVDPSYVVVGNIPIVIRESLLPKAIEMGESVVEVSKEICSPGLYGPFCLEGVLTPLQEFVIFEISARIVAGTNVYMRGSPYTALKYNKHVSNGRRIAMEIKFAIEQGKLNKITE